MEGISFAGHFWTSVVFISISGRVWKLVFLLFFVCSAGFRLLCFRLLLFCYVIFEGICGRSSLFRAFLKDGGVL